MKINHRQFSSFQNFKHQRRKLLLTQIHNERRTYRSIMLLESSNNYYKDKSPRKTAYKEVELIICSTIGLIHKFHRHIKIKILSPVRLTLSMCLTSLHFNQLHYFLSNSVFQAKKSIALIK